MASHQDQRGYGKTVGGSGSGGLIIAGMLSNTNSLLTDTADKLSENLYTNTSPS
jgi:hypothetical protein